MEYRKRKGSDIWHWNATCVHWPVLNYEKKITRPNYGELCDECRKESIKVKNEL